MRNLSRRLNRFMIRNRNAGIPNLMLWIGIFNLISYLIFLVFKNITLSTVLMFDAAAISRGELWRIVTYPLTLWLNFVDRAGLIKLLLFCYVCYWTGSVVEEVWGRLRLNLYILAGVLLTALGGLLLYWCADLYVSFTGLYHCSSLFLVVAALMPESRVLFFYFIPMRMRWAALIGLAIDLFYITDALVAYTPHLGFWVALAGVGTEFVLSLVVYLLFLWENVGNLFGRRVNRYAPPRQPRQTAADPGRSTRSAAGQSYHHKCTVCGRTDADCPGLEFRYCSKCKGYFCYCIDHINNHEHVQ